MKSGAERQKQYAANKKARGEVALNIIVPLGTRDRLNKIMKDRHLVTLSATLEWLINNAENASLTDGASVAFSAIETAKKLFAQHNGDAKSARETYLQELREIWPEYIVNGDNTKKSESLYEPQRRFNSVRKNLDELKKKASSR